MIRRGVISRRVDIRRRFDLSAQAGVGVPGLLRVGDEPEQRPGTFREGYDLVSEVR